MLQLRTTSAVGIAVLLLLLSSHSCRGFLFHPSSTASSFYWKEPSKSPGQPARRHRHERINENHQAATSATTKTWNTALNIHSSFQVTLEYCTGCRWGLRSFWMAQELLTTFCDDPFLAAVTLIPSDDAGTFRVQCRSISHNDENEQQGDNNDEDEEVLLLLWDRKEQGGFPEMKQLKQLVRDQIDPKLYLGHSDTKERREEDGNDGHPTTSLLQDTADAAPAVVGASLLHSNNMNTVSPHVAITYCTGCRWLLRAAWFAQELILSTFSHGEIKSLSLIPSRPPVPGGTFTISMDDKILWDRAAKGHFPEITELKRMIRDIVDPTKYLGHSDDERHKSEHQQLKEEEEPAAMMSDEEAAEMRKRFGVS